MTLKILQTDTAMPTEEEVKKQSESPVPIPEDNRVQVQAQAHPETITETKVEETPAGEFQYLGKVNGQDVYKTGETLRPSSKTTTTTNEKVLNEKLSQAATEAQLATFPRPDQIEAFRKIFTPAGEDKNNQERLDRLNRMGKINEFGRSVNVLGDIFSLAKGANVRLRKPDDIAPRLFDAEDNIYKKKDDADRKRNDDIMKVIAGRAAKPVYDTVTTKEEKTDYTKSGKYQLKDPNAGKDGAGKDNNFNIYNETGQVVATVQKDKAMKALSMIEQDKSISATDMNSVRLMKVKMADGSLSDNEIYYLVQGLSLKYPSVRKFLGVSDNNSERGAGETVPFKNGIDINGKNVNVSDLNNANPAQREAMAQRNKIKGISGNEPAAQLNLGGTTVDISKGDYEAARLKVLSDPKNQSLEEKELHNLTMQQVGDDLKKGQKQQYLNADGSLKPEVRQTATGKQSSGTNWNQFEVK